MLNAINLRITNVLIMNVRAESIAISLEELAKVRQNIEIVAQFVVVNNTLKSW